MIDEIFNFGQGLLSAVWWASLAWPVIWALIKVTLVLMLVLGAVTYTTLWERKLLAWVQIRLGPHGMVAFHSLGVAVAAEQNHREVGRELTQHRQGLPAVHPGHDHVTQHATNFALMLPEDLDGRDPVLRCEHRIITVLEREREGIAQHLVVLHHQHRGPPAAVFGDWTY